MGIPGVPVIVVVAALAVGSLGGICSCQRSPGSAGAGGNVVSQQAGRYAETFDDIPGMGQSHDAARTFALDLGETFDPGSITMVHVYTDTGGLSYDKVACDTGSEDSCDDQLSIIDVETWYRANKTGQSNTSVGRHDTGEHRYYDAKRNPDLLPAAAEAVADGQLSVRIMPHARDDYQVGSIFVEIHYQATDDRR